VFAALAASALALAAPGEAAKQTVAEIAALGPRPAGTATELRVARLVSGRLRAVGYRVTTQTFRLPNGRISRNVVARGEGDAQVLLGAHMDGVRGTRAANDNASGVAVLLEAARELRDQPGVIFVAFGAEERVVTGSKLHLGSARFVRDAWTRSLRHALVLDMVGVGSRLFVRGLETTPNRSARLALAQRGSRYFWDPGQSDHAELTRAGIPAAWLQRREDRCWHAACDTVARVRTGHLAEALRIAVGFAEAAAARPMSFVRAPNRFDGRRALEFVRMQVAYGPRPAGSAASRRLAERIRRLVPLGQFQPVPGGLRNVVGRIPGRDPSRTVILGAHYDTEDLPRFLGANDGGSGVAVLLELARRIKPRSLGPTVVLLFFDGEEAPGDSDFARTGMRGSRQAVKLFKQRWPVVVLDMVGDRSLSIPREPNSDPDLWALIRGAAQRVGAGRVFPAQAGPAILDDHIPFKQAGFPAVDLIDFSFPCWHRLCDNMSAVSARSLDLVGETVFEYLRSS
jgi:Zn-dependent M28 family amino/carboxypeptidase